MERFELDDLHERPDEVLSRAQAGGVLLTRDGTPVGVLVDWEDHVLADLPGLDDDIEEA